MLHRGLSSVAAAALFDARRATVLTGPAVALAARRALSVQMRRPGAGSLLLGGRRGPAGLSSSPVAVCCVVAPATAARLQSSDSVPNADPMHEDLYVRLGVGRGADKQDIKRHYRILAKQFHPDQNQGDKAAEEKFRRVKEAYEILSDHNRRRTYDATGSAGAASQGTWKGGTYQYATYTTRMHPVRMYLGIFATSWLLFMVVRWLLDGTAWENVGTFLTMLAFITFFGRIVSACLMFYFYAPSQQAKERHRRGASDTSTVVVTAYVAPHPNTKPTKVVRLTGVDKVAMARRQIEFTFTWAGMEGEPVVVRSKMGEAHVQVPDAVGEQGVLIRAKTLEEGLAVAETAVDLS